MRFTSFLEDGKMTVILNGEIDHHSAKSYIESILSKIEAYVPNQCVLDFSDVMFMDSSGIAVIINALRAMTKMRGQLSLSGLREQPMKVIRTAGVDKLIRIEEGVS